MVYSKLIIDQKYRNTNNWKLPEDEFNKIFKRFKDGKGIQNVQGFRWKSKYSGSTNINDAAFIVIVTNFNEKEWPDQLDYETGIFTYFGDNRKGGSDLHSTLGNEYLKNTFDLIHLHNNRYDIAPILLFQSIKEHKHYMKFLGLLAPGAADVLPIEDLIAVWRVEKVNRFQNYRSIFTILKEAEIDLKWLDDICQGVNPVSSIYCPKSWKVWVDENVYTPLECETTKSIRKLKEQTRNPEEQDIINEILDLTDREFEFAAKEILKLTDPHLFDLEVTRSVKDKGIDIIGKYKIGYKEYSYCLRAIGEAKRWRKKGVNSKEFLRLISRMTKDTIAFFVTTSYFGEAPQKEIIEDDRPIILICGKDIANILMDKNLAGKGYEKELKEWLEKIKTESKIQDQKSY
ncbi:restriction endonuclease [Guptibacillus hwajinpoensis]|uniref:restriction endonuclease n=1 Tax=Guptibacillus hwajinpoensis TaxID=208199 RepID=UPI00384B51DF